MLKKSTAPLQVWREVDICVPIDGKGVTKVPMKIRFEVQPDVEGYGHLMNRDHFMKCVTGWQEYMMDEPRPEGAPPLAEGEKPKEIPVPFNKEELAAFLSNPHVVSSLQQPYLEITIGAARGNS